MRRFIVALGVAGAPVAGPFVVSSFASSSTPRMVARQNGGATRFHADGVDTAAEGRLVAVGAFRASVTCLEVTGNDGIATAVITSSQDPNKPVPPRCAPGMLLADLRSGAHRRRTRPSPQLIATMAGLATSLVRPAGALPQLERRGHQHSGRTSLDSNSRLLQRYPPHRFEDPTSRVRRAT